MAFTQVLPVLLSLRLFMVSSDTLYVGYDASVNWATAKSNCEKGISGQLATWSSATEWTKIQSVSISLGGRSWVGLDDIDGERSWEFIDGDESYCDDTSSDGNCDELPQWYPNEPNDSGNNEDCGESVSWNNGLLNDSPCSGGRKYICEYDVTVAEVSGHTPIAEPIIPPSDNVYIFEFTSAKDVALLVSMVLNVVLVICVGYATIKAFASKSSTYSKVSMYATEDEKL